jgi:hypothetical protein
VASNQSGFAGFATSFMLPQTGNQPCKFIFRRVFSFVAFGAFSKNAVSARQHSDE